MPRPFHRDHLFERAGNWTSRALSWSVSNSGVQFDYYACFAEGKQLWYITGPRDWYAAREGLTTEHMLRILNDPETHSVWISSAWEDL